MTSEFKIAEDLEERARGLLHLIARRAHLDLTDRHIKLLFDEETVSIVSSELLEIFKEGWDTRSIAF